MTDCIHESLTLQSRSFRVSSVICDLSGDFILAGFSRSQDRSGLKS